MSNACEEAIPHGAMPEKKFDEALLRRFSQCPQEPYSGSTKTARSDEHPESNYKKNSLPGIKFGRRFYLQIYDSHGEYLNQEHTKHLRILRYETKHVNLKNTPHFKVKCNQISTYKDRNSAYASEKIVLR